MYCFISIPPSFRTPSRWLVRAWWPAPLLVCWAGGSITFGALWRLWCWGHSSFSSSSSSCFPGSLPLQQVAVGMQRVQVHEQIILRRWRVAALLAHVQLVATLLVGVCLGDAVDLLHVGLQWAALGEGLLTEGTLVWTDPCVGKKRVSHAVRSSLMKGDAVCIYLYACVHVAWGQRCRWSLFRRSCRGVSLSRCDIWHGGLTFAGGGRPSGTPANSSCGQANSPGNGGGGLAALVRRTWHTKDEFWFWAVDLVTIEASGGAELAFTAGSRWFVAAALEMGVCEGGAVTAGSSPVVTCGGNRFVNTVAINNKLNMGKNPLPVSWPLFWLGRRSGCSAATSSSPLTSPRAELPGSAVVPALCWRAARPVLAHQSSWWGRAARSQLGWPLLPWGRWRLQRGRGWVSASLDCCLQMPEGNIWGFRS